jgi:hypothetical protein
VTGFRKTYEGYTFLLTKEEKNTFTLFQLAPRNSFTEMAFCAYISGDIQYPHIHHFFTFSVKSMWK